MLVLESYPRRCQLNNGKVFVEDLGNLLEKQTIIQLFEPTPNQIVNSPLIIKGQARGTWFFEASFPVKLLDGNGKELAIKPAHAKGEWMTENFVPFEVSLEFQKPETRRGVLILEKDNPSGLAEHADELRIPVKFFITN